MAWTAPATWSVSEVVLASKMNAHVRDNLLYLKGQAGDIYIEDDIGVGDSTISSDWAGATRSIAVSTAGNTGAAGLVIKGTRSGADTPFASIAGVNGAATGTDKTGGAIYFNRDGAADSASMSFQTRNAGAVAERMRIDKAGNVGIGTIAPKALLHVGGGPVSTAGLVFGSLAAVTALQTMFAAGTVSRQASFWIFDRNNTGGAGIITYPVNSVLVGGNMTYVNNDTITIAVTAGGAITAQRTVGTNGTHDILILAMVQ